LQQRRQWKWKVYGLPIKTMSQLIAISHPTADPQDTTASLSFGIGSAARVRDVHSRPDHGHGAACVPS
jgi:hypothetical protein